MTDGSLCIHDIAFLADSCLRSRKALSFGQTFCSSLLCLTCSTTKGLSMTKAGTRIPRTSSLAFLSDDRKDDNSNSHIAITSRQEEYRRKEEVPFKVLASDLISLLVALRPCCIKTDRIWVLRGWSVEQNTFYDLQKKASLHFCMRKPIEILECTKIRTTGERARTLRVRSG